MVILSFYKSILGTSDPTCTRDSPSMLKAFLSSSLNPELSAQLITNVTDEEIYNVFKSMPKNKSPGHDGYTADFFYHLGGLLVAQ